ncbi:MAG: hypothetical protein ACOYMR_18005 [Ilumatobacteraceae bacterium]
MTRTRRLLPLLLLVPALVACQDTKAVRGASALQCNQARRDYVSAVENYSILQAKTPTSEMDLVPKYLTSASDLYDVVNGQVVAQTGGGCD